MRRPLIIAHRGASASAPENTLAAFQRAFQLGADGIELDVTLTKDGVPVVIHDDTVDRTSNGRGKVSAMTLAELERLDFGSWFGEKFRGEKIPTLVEVLRAVPRDKLINIELKTQALRSWSPNATQLSRIEFAKIATQMLFRLWEPPRLEPAVVKVIEETQSGNHVIISSFNPLALSRMRQLNPQLPRGLLYFKELPIFLGNAWLRPLARPHALHPRNPMVTFAYMEWANRRGYAVNAWTVDEPIEARRLAEIGVNAIITNQPEVLRDALL
ncbi:MAG: glycerophosphodiester phosphodiesterase [Chloroflexi bacterium]|nr:glycerophosphodiester phosphodiesterase [Chloroflexota bacterium]